MVGAGHMKPSNSRAPRVFPHRDEFLDLLHILPDEDDLPDAISFTLVDDERDEVLRWSFGEDEPSFGVSLHSRGHEVARVSSECARYSRLEKVSGEVILHVEFDMGAARATLVVTLSPPFRVRWHALRCEPGTIEFPRG